jgi:hypothetical protein
MPVQLCIILAASLDSGANSDVESDRGLTSETASDGCSGLYIPLLDAPHVAPLIIPQWRRPDRRDRVTEPHDATIPHLPISTKIYPREPKIANYSNSNNSVIPIPFWILSTHTMAPCLRYSTQFDSRLYRLRARSSKIVCTPGSPNTGTWFPPFRISAQYFCKYDIIQKHSPELSYAG